MAGDPPADGGINAALSPCSVIGGLGPGTRWLAGTGTVAIGARGGKAEADALARADSLARADLRARACVGWSQEDCDMVMRGAVQGMGDPWFDPARGVACSIYGIPGGPVDLAPSRRSAEVAIDGLVSALSAALANGETVRLEPVATPDGCAMPELAAVGFRIRNGLPQVAFEDSGVASLSIREVRLTVSQAGTNLQVTASVVSSDGTARSGGLAVFPGSAYGLEGLIAGTCRSDSAIGLTSGQRAGEAGLQVELGLQADGDRTPDSLCDGQGFALDVAASAPARVHVYSVAGDGTAAHIWPPPPGSGRITGDASLGGFTASPSPGGDERIVAVAVAEGAPIGPLDEHHGFCRVDGFSAAMIPVGAAVSTVTWRMDTRADVCGQASADPAALQVKAAKAREAIGGLPRCGD